MRRDSYSWTQRGRVSRVVDDSVLVLVVFMLLLILLPILVQYTRDPATQGYALFC